MRWPIAGDFSMKPQPPSARHTATITTSRESPTKTTSTSMKTRLWNRSLPEKHWSFTSSPRIDLREQWHEDEILVGHYATHRIAAVSRVPVLAHNRSATRCAPALQRRDCFCGCD